jgi:hypothetical protein
MSEYRLVVAMPRDLYVALAHLAVERQTNTSSLICEAVRREYIKRKVPDKPPDADVGDGIPGHPAILVELWRGPPRRIFLDSSLDASASVVGTCVLSTEYTG